MFFKFSTLYSINNKLQVKVLIIYSRNVEINKRIQLFTQNMFHIISVNTACVDVD